jgi:hypothetical protein
LPQVFRTFVLSAIFFFGLSVLSEWIQAKDKEKKRAEYAEGKFR